MRILSSTPNEHELQPFALSMFWRRAKDATFGLIRDCDYLPNLCTPMFLSVASTITAQSYQRGDEALINCPTCPVDCLHPCLAPFTDRPEQLSTQIWDREAEQVSPQLGEAWKGEWLPELKAYWTFQRSLDPAHAALPDLWSHLEKSLWWSTRLHELCSPVSPSVWTAIDQFDAFYCSLFPDATRLDAHRLLQGFDSRTMEINRALWKLRNMANASQSISQVLCQAPSAEMQAALDQLENGRGFLQELHSFLAAYGGSSSLFDWGYPNWIDNPMPIIDNLKCYIIQPDRDLLAELVTAAAWREAATAQARRKLTGCSGSIIKHFDDLLKIAQAAQSLLEDYVYHGDLFGLGWVHRVIWEIGKHLTAEECLDEVGDVLYLTLDELQESVVGPLRSWATLATTRRRDFEQRTLSLGLKKSITLPRPTKLQGQAGSPGRARGRARLILSHAETQRLRPGDVLVTRTTGPSWAPLFLTAAAVVTDGGWFLSHSAATSRKHNIPSVVGAHLATSYISDGQVVEVDGDSGVIHLL